MRQRAVLREPKRKAKEKTRAQSSVARSIISFALLLFVGTLILYSPVRGHDFINYDDTEYVLNNPHVTAGLTWETIRWSFTSRDAVNWHPVTWLSHALDCELFGQDAGDHHLVNVVIHAMNAVLLFLFLQKATRAVMPSFMVAALFAWHPFNVESVAWVAERKNVLCAFFFFLTLAAYGWYVRRPRIKPFLVVAAVFALSLASKPMAVTLPFLLLLMDYWPLRRIAGWIDPAPESSIPQLTVLQLLLEKLPLLVLSAADSALTIWAQQGGGLRTMQAFPLGARLGNALWSYVSYIGKTFWATGFAIFYPHPCASLAAWKPFLAIALLCVITTVVWTQRKAYPYLVVGWLWFLVTLVPMIGIVQVGDQAMADRYAYLSVLGLFLMIVWSTTALLDRWHVRKEIVVTLVLILLVMMWALTFQQLSYWEDSVAIWSHTLDVTPRNELAEKKLALALSAQGQPELAVPHLMNAVALDPADVSARVNLGVFYASQGRIDDGVQQFEAVIKMTDGKRLSAEERNYRSSALLDLGFAHIRSGDYATALQDLRGANQSDSKSVDRAIETFSRSAAAKPTEDNYIRLSLLLRAQGRDAEARSQLQEAVKANPDYADAQELIELVDTSHK